MITFTKELLPDSLWNLHFENTIGTGNVSKNYECNRGIASLSLGK